MKKLLVVTADENDGDYLTEITDITQDQEAEEFIAKVVKAIESREDEYGHNWPESNGLLSLYDKVLTDEEIERFGYYVPCGQDGVHTIESIEILYVEKIVGLL